MRIRVASTFTAEPFLDWLSWHVQTLLACKGVLLDLAPYGALLSELHSPEIFEGTDAYVGLLHFDDWSRDAGFDADKFEQDVELLSDGIAFAIQKVARLILIVCPVLPLDDGQTRRHCHARALTTLQALARNNARFTVLDGEGDVLGWYPVACPFDSVADAVGHVPFTDECFAALAAACSRALLPSLIPPLKLVVCDCDYTLWSHAVGEVGAAAICFEQRHLRLQSRLVALCKAGVFLALCSRNEEADVWAVLQRGDCQLKREHVAAHSIQPTLRKSEAVAAIAETLEVGVDAGILFIDDNPVEVAEVRAALPQVPCWLFPATSTRLRAHCLDGGEVPTRHLAHETMRANEMEHVWRLDLVGRPASSAADAARTAPAALRARAESTAAMRAARGLALAAAAPAGVGADASVSLSAGARSSLAAFHSELSVRIEVVALSGASTADRERVFELAARTNQFNTWKRHTCPADVDACDGGLVARVADRYANHGVAGAALWRFRHDSLVCMAFMMSCRVLGRGCEYAMIAHLGQVALDAGLSWVFVGASSAPRNKPVTRFLEYVQYCSCKEGGDPIAPASPSAIDLDRAQRELPSAAIAFEDALPERWFPFPAAFLASLKFDPDAAAAADGRLAAAEAGGASAPVPVAVDGARVAEALTRIPASICSASQLLRERAMMHGGGAAAAIENFPQGARIDSSSAVVALRALVGRVLRCEMGLTGDSADATNDNTSSNDDVPLGTLGLESTAAVQLIALGLRHGLPLPTDAWSYERRSIREIAAEVERTTSDARASPRASANAGEVHTGDGVSAEQPRSASETALAPLRVGRAHYGAKAAPSTALRIMERDRRNGQNAPLVAVGGLGACAAGDLPAVVTLAASGRWSAEHAVDKHGSNGLMWAASYGQLAVARWLVVEARVDVDARNKAGRTALMFAAKYGQLAVVRYLLDEAGASIELRMKDDSSAFDWAVLGGDVGTMDYLADRVDLTAVNRFGCAAVQWAAAAGNVGTLRWLQRRGVNLGHVNGAHHGAVAKAAWKGHEDALRWLLLAEDGPRLCAQLRLRDPQGRSVADLSSLNGMNATAAWLAPLVAEADADALRDDTRHGDSGYPRTRQGSRGNHG